MTVPFGFYGNSLTSRYSCFGLLLFIFIAQTTALPLNDTNFEFESSSTESTSTPSLLENDEVKGPLTDHFVRWLENHGFDSLKFNRPDLGPYASFGGKIDDDDRVINSPVIFIHGNSDGALAIDGPYSSGYSSSISYFLKNGYKSSELYVTTWGDRNSTNAHLRIHSCRFLSYLRMFVDAVLEYTKADKINIISHSMGVTLARRIVKGGLLLSSDSYMGYCVLGQPLGNRVNVFIGLAGANTGMCNCAGADDILFPTCNKETGFWPGDYCGQNHLTCGDDPQPYPCTRPQYSQFLEDLNSDPYHLEGNFIASLWSHDDDILGHGCNVYGYPTPLIPNSNYYHILSGYNHMDTKDKTAAYQFNLINYRKIT
uniref:Lipase n=1 Tax=Panagrellus redivivus TaxID=6233 RepID=A0A7E4V4G2_PANRE